MQIRPDRKISMAMKWLILYSRRRNEKSMAQRFECLAGLKKKDAVKKRMDITRWQKQKHSLTLDFNS
jgi:small subunit ribosomal protein S7